MGNILLDFLTTAIPLALFAWLSVPLSRPFFKKKGARITSQTIATILLMLAFVTSKAVSGEATASETVSTALFIATAFYFLAKGIAIYLIASYAKSVGKSPYWGFVGVLNFTIALVLMISGLWRSAKPSDKDRSSKRLTRVEMIAGLKQIIDDPSTPRDKREWASDRLLKLAK